MARATAGADTDSQRFEDDSQIWMADGGKSVFLAPSGSAVFLVVGDEFSAVQEVMPKLAEALQDAGGDSQARLRQSFAIEHPAE